MGRIGVSQPETQNSTHTDVEKTEKKIQMKQFVDVKGKKKKKKENKKPRWDKEEPQREIYRSQIGMEINMEINKLQGKQIKTP